MQELSLFGSVARDEGGAGSDVDLLVAFRNPPGFDGYMKLKWRLEELLGRRVDLVMDGALTCRPCPPRAMLGCRRMLLQPEDAALFYRAWGALLTWVNEQRSIVPRFPRPTPGHPIEASLANQIRKVVWAEDVLREQFLAEGAAGLGSEERDLIASWKHRVSDKFILLKHLQKHSLFLSQDVYGVLGIYTPLEVLLPNVPMFVEAVLIPFRDVIITDGFVESPPMQISFGGGARRSFNAQYSVARATSQIRTALPWRADPKPRAPSARQKTPRKPSRRRTQRG